MGPSREKTGMSSPGERPSDEEEVGTQDEGGAGDYGSDTGANMAVAAAGELIGTFVLIFCGTAVAVAATLSEPTAGGSYDSLAVALAFGLALAAVVAALGHISGAHVNPAVTLGLATTRKFPWRFVPAYVGAQIVGAILGALATWLTFANAGRDDANLGATLPAGGVTDGRALAVEARPSCWSSSSWRWRPTSAPPRRPRLWPWASR